MTDPAQPALPAWLDESRGPRRHSAVRVKWAPRQDLVAGAYLVAALAVLGALLGVLWQLWSPPGPIGYVVAPHAIQPDETEAFIAGDGRFAIICTATGLLAGSLAWTRKATRGPVMALALVAGGLLGSLLTALVGHLLGGGKSDGKTNTLLHELPLTVHMRGLLVLEATLAVLVYSVCASFAAADDLGRPESDAGSVGVGEPMQGVGRDRDAPGALQQSYLPPQ